MTTVELQQLGSALIEAESVGVPWVIDEANPKSKHTPKIWKQQRQVADPGAVAAIRLLLFTGPRLREILHLEWTQFSVSVGSGLRLRFRFPLDGDRIRRRRCVAGGCQFQGSSSVSRLIGWAPIRAMISVSQASGSMPFMRAVPMSV